MILAAGRGERMRPVTDSLPKALLLVAGRPLIAHLIERLARSGFAELVVNVSHLGHLIERELGDGSRYGVRITYSREVRALETGGGIAYALPLLGAAPFAVVNSDIFCDFEFDRLKPALAALERGERMAHLVLVDNPLHHPRGDFCLSDGRVTLEGARRLTFSGIGAYSPALFASHERGTRCPLTALLAPAMAGGLVGGEYHRGLWMDVGTPQRLAELERALASAGT